MKVNYIYSNISNNNQQYLLHIILKRRKPTMKSEIICEFNKLFHLKNISFFKIIRVLITRVISTLYLSYHNFQWKN